VLTELSSLGVPAEALRVNIGSKSAISLHRGPDDPKFQVERVATEPTILLLRKCILSYGIKIWQIFLPFCHNLSVWQRDGRTNRRSDGQLSHRYTPSAFHAAR